MTDHQQHTQAGRAALEQTAPAGRGGIDHDKMQSYAQAEDAATPLARAAMGHPASDMTGMDHSKVNQAEMAGMDHSKMDHGGMNHDMSDPVTAAAMEGDMRNRFFAALLLTTPIILYSPLGEGLGLRLPSPIPVNWLLLILSTPVVFWAGWIFVGGAFSALRRRNLDMSVLIATGVLAAYLFSVYITLTGGMETFYDAATMLVTFVLFGHWMEMRSRRGTTDSLRALFDLVPPKATVIRGGQELEINTADVVVGDRLRLRPGDKVAVDGMVESGVTTVDEALVTGESLPIGKEVGDPMIGGSINQSGSVVMRATKVGADTALGQITNLVRQAQNTKAPGQRLADRAAGVLVIVAVGSGILTFLAWTFLAGAPTIVALTFAISAIVIACPDALGLATPTAVAVGVGLGAKYNILIKDAATLEGVAGIKAIVLDKTGTLTEGKPQLTDVVLADGATVSEDELLRLVASAEVGSEHPLATAITQGAKARNLALEPSSDFAALSGRGLSATVAGRKLLVGNRRLLDEQGVSLPADFEQQANALAEAGRTPMFVAVDGRIAGIVAVADTIKPTARQTIEQLKARGVEPVMITGDNQHTAAAVARVLGIERFYAEVLPADKAKYVRELQAEGKKVAMVGDGVNDAPALATANIGIAIGAGTDVAIETANIVLMKSDPLDIVRAIILSQATVTKMKQNLFWASIYNLLAIPLAAGLFYSSLGWQIRPEIAALLMSVSSIIVATNAVLLRSVEGKLKNPTLSTN